MIEGKEYVVQKGVEEAWAKAWWWGKGKNLAQRRNRKRVCAPAVLAEGRSTLRKQQPHHIALQGQLGTPAVFSFVESNFLQLFLAGCGGTLYGDHGSFTSPGYPGTYPNNTHCEWAIIAPAGRLVTVSFYFISIDDPGDCVQNYLILYDGPDANSPSSGPYCGTVSKARFFKFPFIMFK